MRLSVAIQPTGFQPVVVEWRAQGVPQTCFDMVAKDYKGGDMRAKDAYDALMDMIEKLEGRTAQRAIPSQKTIYHQLAQLKNRDCRKALPGSTRKRADDFCEMR